jgi:cyanophycinase
MKLFKNSEARDPIVNFRSCYSVVTIIFLLTGLFGCNVSAEKSETDQYTQSNGNGFLMIIGGGSRPESMLRRMIEDSEVDESGYAIVLTMAGGNPDTSGYYGERQFRELGVDNIRSYDFGRRDAVTDTGLDSLRNAKLVYITGGSQSRFMDAVNAFPDIAGAIKAGYENGAMISGTSAGAAIMSKIMITGDQNNYPDYTSTFYHLEKDNIVTTEGLGLIEGVIVDQHFLKRARNNRLLTAVMEFPDQTGIGIDESTAILVKNGRAEVVGDSQVLVYKNESGSSRQFQNKLGANNIRLDIYLPGDQFEL